MSEDQLEWGNPDYDSSEEAESEFTESFQNEITDDRCVYGLECIRPGWCDSNGHCYREVI